MEESFDPINDQRKLTKAHNTNKSLLFCSSYLNSSTEVMQGDDWSYKIALVSESQSNSDQKKKRISTGGMVAIVI